MKNLPLFVTLSLVTLISTCTVVKAKLAGENFEQSQYPNSVILSEIPEGQEGTEVMMTKPVSEGQEGTEVMMTKPVSEGQEGTEVMMTEPVTEGQEGTEVMMTEPVTEPVTEDKELPE